MNTKKSEPSVAKVFGGLKQAKSGCGAPDKGDSRRARENFLSGFKWPVPETRTGRVAVESKAFFAEKAHLGSMHIHLDSVTYLL